MQGEFYNRNHPQEAPFPPPPLPGVQATERMMYLWLSDYMADTAGYVYQKAGVLQYQMTPENTCESRPVMFEELVCAYTGDSLGAGAHNTPVYPLLLLMGVHWINWASN